MAQINHEDLKDDLKARAELNEYRKIQAREMFTPEGAVPRRKRRQINVAKSPASAWTPAERFNREVHPRQKIGNDLRYALTHGLFTLFFVMLTLAGVMFALIGIHVARGAAPWVFATEAVIAFVFLAGGCTYGIDRVLKIFFGRWEKEVQEDPLMEFINDAKKHGVHWRLWETQQRESPKTEEQHQKPEEQKLTGFLREDEIPANVTKAVLDSLLNLKREHSDPKASEVLDQAKTSL